MNRLKKYSLTALASLAILAGGILFSTPEIVKNFQANIFGGGAETAASGGVNVFIPNDYTATPGQVGKLVIRSNGDFDKIVGFSATITYNPAKISIKNFSIAQTILEGKGFFVDKNLGKTGEITIVAVSGGDGIAIKKGDDIVAVEAGVDMSAAFGESFEMGLKDVQLIKSDLSEVAMTPRAGKITIGSSGTLQATGLVLSRGNEITISFNDEIVAAPATSFEFSGNLAAVPKTTRVDGRNVIISLGSDIPAGEQFWVTLKSGITGNVAGALSGGEQKIPFFRPSISPTQGSFAISKVEPLLNANGTYAGSLKITFTDAVKPQSLETAHFYSWGSNVPRDINTPGQDILTFSALPVLGADGKSITIETGEIPGTSNDSYMAITRHSYVEIKNPATPTAALQSINGDPLVSRFFIVPPFAVVKDLGPKIASVVTQEGFVTINFAEPIKGTFINPTIFTLTELSSGTNTASPNLITSSTKTEVSADFKSVTLSPVTTLKNKSYALTIAATTIASGPTTAHPNINSPYPIQTMLMGSSSQVFDPDFGILSIQTVSDTEVLATFTKAPSADSVRALSFAINSLTGGTPLKVIAVKAEGNAVRLTTEKQTGGTPYSLLTSPDLWKTAAGASLGGKNLAFFTGFSTALPRVIRVVPDAFALQDTPVELKVVGENFSDKGKLTLGGTPVEMVSVSADKTTIIARVPSTQKTGALEFAYFDEQGNKYTFVDQEVVNPKEVFITVLSSESYASPRKVPNDGKTKTTLWVRIKDPLGVADIEKVTVDLRPIDGVAGAMMTPGPIVDLQQWFSLEITVPTTVNTQIDPYQLTVTAENKSGIRRTGNASLIVSKDLTGGIAPDIKNSFADPAEIVTNDKENPVRFFVEVSDEDGASNIASVAVELAQIGQGTIFLTPQGTEVVGKTRFFESAAPGFVTPARIPDGLYKLPLTVTDKDGMATRSTITVRVGKNSSTGPKIDESNFYVSPDYYLVADGISKFKLHVKVEDPGGADDIQGVSANLVELGLEPIALTPGLTEGRTRWFSSADLTVPIGTFVGTKKIEVTATDKAGNYAVQKMNVYVVNKPKRGNPPLVLSAKGYTTPANVIPDGKTKFSAYVFVEDMDDDLSRVVLNLGNQAVYTADALPDGTSSLDKAGNEQCISTRTLLCMRPILKEGNGQWFHVPDLVVPPGVENIGGAFRLPVNAMDKTQKTAEGYLELYIASENLTSIKERPYPKSSIATGPSEVQIIFSSPIDRKVVRAENFQIVKSANSADILNIKAIDVSVDGRVVTLYTTGPQIPKDKYSIIVDAKELQLRQKQVADNVVSFTGYEKIDDAKKKSLKITRVDSTSSTAINITFNEELAYTSVLNPENIKIFEKGGTHHLEVKEVDMYRPNVLQVITSAQTPDRDYQVFVENISSPLTKNDTRKMSYDWKGYSFLSAETLQSLQKRADFNNDKIVDFKDFTLFSSVYGSTSDNAGDLNQDGKVDFTDFTLFSSRYGGALVPNQPSTANGTNGQTASPGPTTSGSTSSTSNINPPVNAGVSVVTNGVFSSTSSLASPTPTLRVTPSPSVSPGSSTALHGAATEPSASPTVTPAVPTIPPTPYPTPTPTPYPTATPAPTLRPA
ncbi:MAG: hypothetical protein WCJ84_04330 [Candidatus Peregrinibacteria bacterium]